MFFLLIIINSLFACLFLTQDWQIKLLDDDVLIDKIQVFLAGEMWLFFVFLNFLLNFILTARFWSFYKKFSFKWSSLLCQRNIDFLLAITAHSASIVILVILIRSIKYRLFWDMRFSTSSSSSRIWQGLPGISRFTQSLCSTSRAWELSRFTSNIRAYIALRMRVVGDLSLINLFITSFILSLFTDIILLSFVILIFCSIYSRMSDKNRLSFTQKWWEAFKSKIHSLIIIRHSCLAIWSVI